MKEIPKIPKEDAEYFLDLHEKLKEYDLSGIDLKKMGIEKLTLIAVSHMPPTLYIKYCDGTDEEKEAIKGIENIINKAKELLNK